MRKEDETVPRQVPAVSSPLALLHCHGLPLKCASFLSLGTGLSLMSSHTGWNSPTQTVLKPKEREGKKKKIKKHKGIRERNTNPRKPVTLTTD